MTAGRFGPPVDFVIVTALEEERDAVLSLLPSAEQIPPSRHDIRLVGIAGGIASRNVALGDIIVSEDYARGTCGSLYVNGS